MREVRYTDSEFELRGASGEGATLMGYAAVYESPTEIGGRFREQVGRRAFNKSIKEGDVRALFNHDPNIVLGRNKAGTLRLQSDEHGLRYEIDLPQNHQARDLWVSIERGDISQSSFAFEMQKQTIEQASEEGELPLRTLNQVRLYDISPVTYAAYEDTEVLARAAEAVYVVITRELESQSVEIADGREDATTAEQSVEQPPALDDTPQQEPALTGTPLYVARLFLTEHV